MFSTARPKARQPDWTIPQDWSRYTADGACGAGHAVRPPGETVPRPRVRGLSRRGLDVLEAVQAQHPRFRGIVRTADGPDRLAGRGGARPGAGRCVLRPHGQSPLRRGQFHPPARPARLSAGTGRVPRRVRPCADARRPGLCRLSRSLWPRRPARARSSARSKHLCAALLVHGGIRPDCRARGPAHLRVGHRLRASPKAAFALDDPSPNRIAFDLEAGDAHGIPDRRFPAELLRDPELRRTAAADGGDRFRAALRRDHGAAGRTGGGDFARTTWC